MWETFISSHHHPITKWIYHSCLKGAPTSDINSFTTNESDKCQMYRPHIYFYVTLIRNFKVILQWPHLEEIGGSSVVHGWAWRSACGRETSGTDVVAPILSNIIKHHHLSACHQRRTDASRMLVPHHRSNLRWEYCLSNFTLLRTQPSLVLRIISTPATQESTLLHLWVYHFTATNANVVH